MTQRGNVWSSSQGERALDLYEKLRDVLILRSRARDLDRVEGVWRSVVRPSDDPSMALDWIRQIGLSLKTDAKSANVAWPPDTGESSTGTMTTEPGQNASKRESTASTRPRKGASVTDTEKPAVEKAAKEPKSFESSKGRKQEALDHVASGKSIADTARHMGVRYKAVARWTKSGSKAAVEQTPAE